MVSLQARPGPVATALTTVPVVWTTTGLVQTGVCGVGAVPSRVQRMAAAGVAEVM